MPIGIDLAKGLGPAELLVPPPFRFRFPLSFVGAPIVEGGPFMTTATSTIDVLIVEDDADTRASVRLLLEMEGFACEEAEDGPSGIELARQLLPRIVLLDVMLPELNGLQVLEQLRADERTRDMRIYCVTGRSDAEVREPARLLGCAHFLIKPAEPAEMIAQIRAELGASERLVNEGSREYLPQTGARLN